MMRCGFEARRWEGERWRLSRTPGRNGSMRMSVWGRSEVRRRRAEGDLRLRVRERLEWVRGSRVGGGGDEV